MLSALCFLVPSFARLVKLRATTTGIEAEWESVKEDVQIVTHTAEKLLKTLRQIAIENSTLSLELVQRSGWVGGFEEDQKQSILGSTIARLNEIGVTEDEREDILDRAWRRYDRYVYASSILGSVNVPQFGHPRPFDPNDPAQKEAAEKFQKEIYAEWKALRDRWPGEPATPDELAKFIEKTGDDVPERQEILDAYRFYFEHMKHKNYAILAKRNKIPGIKITTVPKANADAD